MPRDNVAQPNRDKVEEMQGFNTTQLEAVRKEATSNLYFFAKGILGYNGLVPHVVGPLCEFMRARTSKTRMMLMPRGHLKTTICTISDTVLNACIDPNNSSTLVVNEIHDNAVDIVSEILGHFETNEMLRLLFPGIIPEKFAGAGAKWSATRGASLIPRYGKKDPSFLAAGISTAVTSKHFTNLKFDDLAGFQANESPAVMKYAKKYVANITPLTLGPDDTIVDFVGTRWSLTDLYAFIQELYGKQLTIFRRGMIENGQPIWPEKYTPEAIEQLMKSPDVYYAQYDNDPLSEASTDFTTTKLRTWRQVGSTIEYTLRGVLTRTEIQDLNRMVLVDPNGGSKTATDESGVIVVGVAPDDARIVLEDASGRHDPTELINRILNVAERWGCGSIGIEQAGPQNIEHFLKIEARKRGLFLRVLPLKHGNSNKQARILKALHSLVEDELIFLHPSQSDLRKQFLAFGGGLDDRIDALSYHTQLVRAPLSALRKQEGRSALDRILARRSSSTGY